MTPERWQQIRDLLEQALDLAPDQRSALLHRACTSDSDLRKEVETLLASGDDVRSSFLNGPPIELTLEKGDKLEGYEVLSLLGSGGMGEVYHARDSRLCRDVAIKVLPSILSSDPDRLRRFEQEARAAAALNHPNILAVFQMGTYNGVPYLVSELLKGETLREQISRGRPEVRRTINYATQVARGLAAAHDKGIVHRDLKPENLFVTKDGPVKILDFGLAKLRQPYPGSVNSWPTLGDNTDGGVIMGTVGYMSPEQVRGESADHRVDIFAFGAILYEMLVGSRAFKKQTPAETMTAILHDDPPGISQIVPAIPPALQRIVHRCLEKNPEQRFQSAADLAFALETQSDSEVLPVPVAQPRPKLRSFRLQVTAPIAVLFVCAAIVAWWITRRSPIKGELKQHQLTTNISGSEVASGSISPDGKYLAFWDVQGIHLKVLATGDMRAIPTPPALIEAGAVWWGIGSWFPDGSRFLANAIIGRRCSIWVVSVLGDAPKKLRDDAWAWAISPDGSRIAFGTANRVTLGVPVAGPVFSSKEIWTMGPNGEQSEKFLSAPDNTASFELATWSPDGQRVAYESVRHDEATGKVEQTLEIRNAKSEPAITVLSNPNLGDFVWLRDGRIIYSQFEDDTAASNLWEIRVADTGEARSRPRRLTRWAGYFLSGLTVTADGRRLAFQKSASQSSIYIGDFNILARALKPLKQLTFTEGMNLPMGFTTDSSAVIFTSNRNGHWGIFRQKLGEDSAEVLVSGTKGAEVLGGHSSPDGVWVIYNEYTSDSPSAASRLMRVSLQGGPPEFILSPHSSFHGAFDSPESRCSLAPAAVCAFLERAADGHQLVFTAFDPSAGRGQQLVTFTADPNDNYAWDLSPDGKFIALLREGDNTIHMLHLDGGPDRNLTVKGWSNLGALSFSARSEGWFVYSISNGEGTLLYVDLAGKTRPIWQHKSSNAGWANSSPDGRRLALMVQGFSGNMWMIEDF